MGEARGVAVLQFQNRTIAYNTVLAPFAADMFFLQSSRMTQGFWQPVIENLTATLGQPSGGRLVTCDWHENGRSTAELGEDLAHFIRTLGLNSVYVVACDDAVKVAQAAEERSPSLFAKTLYFHGQGPKGDEMIRAVHAFCPI
jgi:hypothetical protein